MSPENKSNYSKTERDDHDDLIEELKGLKAIDSSDYPKKKYYDTHSAIKDIMSGQVQKQTSFADNEASKGQQQSWLQRVSQQFFSGGPAKQ